MKVLITGANGFVGREIVSELSARNFEVIQVGGKRSGNENKMLDNSEALKAGEILPVDIARYETLLPLENIGRVGAVIHSAGLAHQFKNIERERFEAVNVEGTKNVLRLALKLKAEQFILIGSTAVYGIKKTAANVGQKLSEIEIDETAECRPATVYAESKLEAENAARDICEKNNVALTIFRLAPVVGEDSAGNTARLIEAIDGNRFLWVGAGQNYKSLIYKRDAARACAAVLPNKKGGTEIFNLAAEPLKMADFVRMIAENLGKSIPPVKIPAAVLELIFRVNRKTFEIKKIDNLAGTIEKWLSDDVYSTGKIADAYGFKAETSIETAVEKQIAAYRTNRKKHK